MLPPSRCKMNDIRKRQPCQRNTNTCAIVSLILLIGLVIFVVIYVTVDHQGVDIKSSTQNYTGAFNDEMFDDCTSKATVVTDKVLMQKWDSCNANFSKAWSSSEQIIKKPAHRYMDSRHSFALYVYTGMMLKSVTQNIHPSKRNDKTHSLYSFLSEAIQILRHSQVTCHSTSYKTETLLHLNVSDQLFRFSTFMLGLKEWNATSKASCFQLYTCFGADVTYYSALTQNNQVMIPPYEVFKVTDVKTETKNCKVVYTLRSNMNCVYDRESKALHAISALPAERLWIIFAIVCIIIVFLLLAFFLVKVYNRKNC